MGAYQDAARVSAYIFGMFLSATAASCGEAPRTLEGRVELLGGSTPVDELEPPRNPFLAGSPWSGVHRNPYRQGSSPFGTRSDGRLRAQQLPVPGLVAGWTHFSPFYPDRRRVIWSIATPGTIIKIDPVSFQIIDSLQIPEVNAGLNAAYYELTSNNNIFFANGRFIEVYGDRNPNRSRSPIVLKKSIRVPERFFCRDEHLAAVGVAYDGNIIALSELGQVGVLSLVGDGSLRGQAGMNGDACEDPQVSRSKLESIDNGFAVDEAGGLYPVSNQAMYRFQWDGTSIRESWRVPYRADGRSGAIEVGRGSGSTPTLMGTPGQPHQLVVITDAQDIKHFVAFFRDEIPADWPGLGGGRDRRMACEHPVDFGTVTSRTATEQSISVAGYAAIVVNNLLSERTEAVLESLPMPSRVVLAALLGGDPRRAPRGIERIDWDPSTRRCRTVWANPRVSFPNAVPLISRGSGLVLGSSLDGFENPARFGVRALALSTGQTRWFVPNARQSCPPGTLEAALAELPEYAAFAPFIPENACGNGFFAPQQVDDTGTLYQGTFLGLSRFTPTACVRPTSAPPPAAKQPRPLRPPPGCRVPPTQGAGRRYPRQR